MGKIDEIGIEYKWALPHGARMGFTWDLVGQIEWVENRSSHMGLLWVLHGVCWAR